MGLKVIKPVLEAHLMFEAKAQSGSKAESRHGVIST
jgi:uncharacterized phosphosugar-binding protein